MSRLNVIHPQSLLPSCGCDLLLALGCDDLPHLLLTDLHVGDHLHRSRRRIKNAKTSGAGGLLIEIFPYAEE